MRQKSTYINLDNCKECCLNLTNEVEQRNQIPGNGLSLVINHVAYIDLASGLQAIQTTITNVI